MGAGETSRVSKQLDNVANDASTSAGQRIAGGYYGIPNVYTIGLFGAPGFVSEKNKIMSIIVVAMKMLYIV